MTGAAITARRGAGELRKIPAFMRRDLLVMLSYRVAFAGDLMHIGVQAVLFYFMGKLVDDERLPVYGTTQATYLEFTMVGIVLTLVSALLLQRVATAVRQEQMIGTLEALLETPTATTTIQAGSVAFDLLLIPLRMALLLTVVALAFGLGFDVGGVVPAFVIVAAFVPFLWGLGLVSAAAIVTFRRGAGALTAGMGILGIVSGAFFPLSLLPAWLQDAAEANPVAIAMEGVRDALIGGTGWSGIGPDVLVMLPSAVLALLVGVFLFRAALDREYRRGTLGLY